MKIASFRSRLRSPAFRQVFAAIVCPRKMSQRMRRGASPRLAAGFALACMALAACTTSPSGSSSGHATAQDLLALNHIQDASGIHTRDLLPEEKQVISKAVSLSIVNPA